MMTREEARRHVLALVDGLDDRFRSLGLATHVPADANAIREAARELARESEIELMTSGEIPGTSGWFVAPAGTPHGGARVVAD